MADTITHTWQTVELAAVTLNCSTRTIARRIAGGTIESRVDENGRRLVLVETFAPAAAGSDTPADGQTADVGEDFGENALAIAAASSLAKPMPVDAGYSPAATSVLVVLQSTIDAARNDAARARVGARWAWAGMAVMAAAVGVTAVFFTGRLTRAEVRVEMLQGDMQTARTDLDRSRNDLLIVSSAKAVADQRRDTAEQQLAAAEAQRAAAESELASAKREAFAPVVQAATAKPADKVPATQGTSFFGRFVNLPIEPEAR